MAKKSTKVTLSNRGKISFGKKKKGKATKHTNKRVSKKTKYRGQGR
jgi:hypothetical protein|tara:strand:- start:871 stop:1008 length:138 start_codon:yes stop_codon:yes gene_type:complete